MDNFYKFNGQIMTDSSGHPIKCDTCPCSPPDGCCPNTHSYPIYLWASLISAGYPVPPTFTGCIPGLYGFGDPSPWNCFKWGSSSIFTIPWNTKTPGSPQLGTMIIPNYPFDPTGGCINFRLTSTCSAGPPPAFSSYLEIKSDTDTFPSDFTGVGTISSVSNCTPAYGCIFDSLGGMNYFLTDRDPTTGILCPDGSVLATDITVDLTLGGIHTGSYPPQPVTLTFSPNLLLNAVWNLFIDPTEYCYTWFGHYLNCSEAETRIALYYDGTNWNLGIGDPHGPGTARIVYSAPTLPTTDSTGDASSCCDTYTMNYPMTLLAPRVHKKHSITNSNLCEKCGAEKTKLVSCKTCKGNVRVKTCPKCG